jgi:2,3-bisphosphoglycerate-independent phosphoglycerate mutase
MKIAFLIGDGMGDFPVDSLGGKTPLQAATATHMRRIAAAGEVTMVRVAPPNMFPGSDVCNLALLGYNPSDNYTGRAPIEAAGAGIPLQPNDVAYRCNLVTVQDEIMRDHSSSHITDAEAFELVAALKPAIDRAGLCLHPGVSYRHLLVWQEGPVELTTEMPHEILDQPIAPHLPSGPRSDEVRALMDASRDILADHPVNQARIAAGKNPATQIWLWGQGRALSLVPYQERYGLTGGMITAVDLLRGLGVLAGLEIVNVEGATGFVDTNYEGKARAALEVLDRHDFVYVHLEAPDECGHQGDAALKTQAISDFDARIVGPIWQALEEKGEPYRLMVTMDHRTPVSTRGHSAEPTPIAVLDGPIGPVTEEAAFDESCNGGEAQGQAHEVIDELLRNST